MMDAQLSDSAGPLSRMDGRRVGLGCKSKTTICNEAGGGGWMVNGGEDRSLMWCGCEVWSGSCLQPNAYYETESLGGFLG